MRLTQKDSNLQMSLDVIDLRGKHCQIIVLRHLTLTHPNVVVARRRQSMLVVVVDSLIRVDHTCDLRPVCTSCWSSGLWGCDPISPMHEMYINAGH